MITTAAALAAAMVPGTGYVRKPGVETSEIVISWAPAEETTKIPETTVKAPGIAEQAAEAKEVYHVLQRTVTKVTGDGAVFTLQADDGRGYDISQSDVRNVEVEIDKNVQIAVTYTGELLGKPEDVTLIVTLPEQEEWGTLTGRSTTTANAMSSFTMKTDDGQKLSFLKNNCPIEEGTLTGDGGGKVTVTHVSSQRVNYLMEAKGTKQTDCRHNFTKNPREINALSVQSNIE